MYNLNKPTPPDFPELTSRVKDANVSTTVGMNLQYSERRSLVCDGR